MDDYPELLGRIAEDARNRNQGRPEKGESNS
jgi:hypothetical protein